ncbi:MAG TPA: hypothetical protein VEP90_20260 [Methylomirabilota bacterium]|nr:hypothetical protein [Methylomirabilota bacterium]
MNYILTLTEQDLLILSESLGNMPFKTVSALVVKLQQQVNEQNEAKTNAHQEKED